MNVRILLICNISREGILILEVMTVVIAFGALVALICLGKDK